MKPGASGSVWLPLHCIDHQPSVFDVDLWEKEEEEEEEEEEKEKEYIWNTREEHILFFEVFNEGIVQDS